METRSVTTSMEMRKIDRLPERHTEFKRQISLFFHLKSINEYLNLHYLVGSMLYQENIWFPNLSVMRKCIESISVSKQSFYSKFESKSLLLIYSIV